jgi:hypothetical protein
MEAWVSWRGDTDDVADEVAKWSEAGASHLSINTMGAGLDTVDDHLAALAAVADAIPKR